MIKLIAKCLLSLFGWMFLICTVWIGTTVLFVYVLGGLG